MIDKTQLDGPLSVIYFHNVKRNQPFDTEWISDLSEEKIREIVMLLEADGYITYHVAKEEYHESYMCTLTNKGIQFCNAGGYKKQKSNELKKIILSAIGVIAAIASIIAVIWQILN